MIQERRKVVGGIFADAAKYTLTAGVVGSILSGKYSVLIKHFSCHFFRFICFVAYFITPKDKKEN